MPQNLKVNKPSTFNIKFDNELPSIFRLYDQNGDLYHYRILDRLTPRIKFNIPDEGDYFSNCPFSVTKERDIILPDKWPELPPPERDRFKPVEYVTDSNLNDISMIDTRNGIIVCGKQWLDMPKPVRLFILLHEKAHFFYKTEEHCDLMAMIDYLRLGYNRSMAYYALDNYLYDTTENRKRVHELLKNIQKTQNTNLWQTRQ